MFKFPTRSARPDSVASPSPSSDAGHVRYVHVGEGACGRTEGAIRTLLDEPDHGSQPGEAGVR
jgi:hypothetical protein